MELHDARAAGRRVTGIAWEAGFRVKKSPGHKAKFSRASGFVSKIRLGRSPRTTRTKIATSNRFPPKQPPFSSQIAPAPHKTARLAGPLSLSLPLHHPASRFAPRCCGGGVFIRSTPRFARRGPVWFLGPCNQ